MNFFIGEENWTDDEENDVFGHKIEVEESESDDDIANNEEITEQTAAPKSTSTTQKKPLQTTGKENKKLSRRCPECQKDYNHHLASEGMCLKNTIALT